MLVDTLKSQISRPTFSQANIYTMLNVVMNLVASEDNQSVSRILLERDLRLVIIHFMTRV